MLRITRNSTQKGWGLKKSIIGVLEAQEQAENIKRCLIEFEYGIH